MSEERKDYIDEAQQEAQLRWGRELSPEEIAEKFAGHDLEARVFHMKALKNEGELTVTQAANRMEYEYALRHVHETLRKAGR